MSDINKPRVMSGEELADDLKKISGARDVFLTFKYSTNVRPRYHVMFSLQEGKAMIRLCRSIDEIYGLARSLHMSELERITHGIFETEIEGDSTDAKEE